jgi:hypothetical protein
MYTGVVAWRFADDARTDVLELRGVARTFIQDLLDQTRGVQGDCLRTGQWQYENGIISAILLRTADGSIRVWCRLEREMPKRPEELVVEVPDLFYGRRRTEGEIVDQFIFSGAPGDTNWRVSEPAARHEINGVLREEAPVFCSWQGKKPKDVRTWCGSFAGRYGVGGHRNVLLGYAGELLYEGGEDLKILGACVHNDITIVVTTDGIYRLSGDTLVSIGGEGIGDEINDQSCGSALFNQSGSQGVMLSMPEDFTHPNFSPNITDFNTVKVLIQIGNNNGDLTAEIETETIEATPVAQGASVERSGQPASVTYSRNYSGEEHLVAADYRGDAPIAAYVRFEGAATFHDYNYLFPIITETHGGYNAIATTKTLIIRGEDVELEIPMFDANHQSSYTYRGWDDFWEGQYSASTTANEAGCSFLDLRHPAVFLMRKQYSEEITWPVLDGTETTGRYSGQLSVSSFDAELYSGSGSPFATEPLIILEGNETNRDGAQGTSVAQIRIQSYPDKTTNVAAYLPFYLMLNAIPSGDGFMKVLEGGALGSFSLLGHESLVSSVGAYAVAASLLTGEYIVAASYGRHPLARNPIGNIGRCAYFGALDQYNRDMSGLIAVPDETAIVDDDRLVMFAALTARNETVVTT